jgi:hypothetical protein
MLKERTRRLVHGTGVMTVARIEFGYDPCVKTGDIFPGPHRPAASSPLILPCIEGKIQCTARSGDCGSLLDRHRSDHREQSSLLFHVGEIIDNVDFRRPTTWSVGRTVTPAVVRYRQSPGLRLGAPAHARRSYDGVSGHGCPVAQVDRIAGDLLYDRL